jgi:hypothetical protein
MGKGRGKKRKKPDWFQRQCHDANRQTRGGEKMGEGALIDYGPAVGGPTDRWLWTTLGLTFYERRRYETALQCSKRAVALAPDCPLVLWDAPAAYS